MGLADVLGGAVGGKGKPKVDVHVVPAFDHFANEVFAAAHDKDPSRFADALRAAIHACMDEYEHAEPDGDEGDGDKDGY